MPKEKLKTDFKGNRSIPDRGTSGPEDVSAKQRKQHAGRSVLEAKPEGTDNGPPTALEDAVGTHC